MSVFEKLNSINVNDHTEKKNGLTYLSWAWAWAEVKKAFPDSTYTIYENADGWNYFTDGRTAWVKTGVTIGGLEHIEYLPVMDFKNKSIPLESITSFDVNKAIQRSLTKAVARHGLGLYIYAGEDLPEDQQVKFDSDKVRSEKISEVKVKAIQQAAENAGILLESILRRFELSEISDMTEAQFLECTALIQKQEAIKAKQEAVKAKK